MSTVAGTFRQRFGSYVVECQVSNVGGLLSVLVGADYASPLLAPGVAGLINSHVGWVAP